MASMSAAPSWGVSSDLFGPDRVMSVSTAVPMGIIISVAAVFDIHMLSSAQASMKPATSRRGDVPVRATTASAMRRWSCQRCIEAAMKKPPMKRKITGFA